MKKLGFIISFLFIFLAAATQVKAACIPRPIRLCQAPTLITCSVTIQESYCCSSASECLQLKKEREEGKKAQTIQEKQLKVCDFAEGKEEACKACFGKNPPEVWTAIGCIPTTPEGFISKFLGLGVGIGGGIAFLLILFGGFQVLTSAGNPERLGAGRELLGSAISGLILLVLSIFLLRLIGFNILGIPGFGG